MPDPEAGRLQDPAQVHMRRMVQHCHLHLPAQCPLRSQVGGAEPDRAARSRQVRLGAEAVQPGAVRQRRFRGEQADPVPPFRRVVVVGLHEVARAGGEQGSPTDAGSPCGKGSTARGIPNGKIRYARSRSVRHGQRWQSGTMQASKVRKPCRRDQMNAAPQVAGGAVAPDWPLDILNALRQAGVTQAAYVPDAGHSRLIQLLHADDSPGPFSSNHLFANGHRMSDLGLCAWRVLQMTRVDSLGC